MPYDVSDLRQSVRDLFQNLDDNVIGVSVLDTFLKRGVRRMSQDRPDEVSVVLDRSSTKWYELTDLIEDWELGFSTLRYVSGVPNFANANENYDSLQYGIDFAVQRTGSIERMRVEADVPVGGLLVKYSIPWKVQGLNGAAETTVPFQLLNSLELACAIELARGRAANSAGSMTKGLGADIVNWRSKQREYSNQAKDWEAVYWLSLGFNKNGAPPPVMVSIDHRPAEWADGWAPITHDRMFP